MRLELTGRQTDITPALRRIVDKKLARLERLLNDSAVSAQVVLREGKRGRRADITLHARGEQFLHAYGEAPVWETALTLAADKIAQQASTLKGKRLARQHGGARRGAGAAKAGGEGRAPAATIDRAVRPRVRTPRIVRGASQPLKAMTATDAAREVAARGDGVVIFRDSETSAVSVLFRRATGELTLVATDV